MDNAFQELLDLGNRIKRRDRISLLVGLAGVVVTILLYGTVYFPLGIVICILKTFLPMNRLITLLEVAAGSAVYVFAAIRTGLISSEDLALIKQRFNRKRNG